MPVIELNNNLFKIRELNIGRDKIGYFLTMNPNKAVTCVLCICRSTPVRLQDLSLQEADLQTLINGGTLNLPEHGCQLRGVTRPQLSAAPQFRNFEMKPPCHIQVWAMSRSSLDGTILHIPQDPLEQHLMVPVEYTVQTVDGGFTVKMCFTEGYQDGDLVYQVADHKPVPIPGTFLNRFINLRPGITPVVFSAPHAQEQYQSL